MGNLSLYFHFSFIFVKILIATALEVCVVSLSCVMTSFQVVQRINFAVFGVITAFKSYIAVMLI